MPYGYVLNVNVSDGRVTALLPFDREPPQLNADALFADGKIAVRLIQPGKQTVVVKED